MKIPDPSAGEVRFVFKAVALCALILSSVLAYGIVHKVNQSDTIVRIAAANADQVQRLSGQLDAQSKAATAERVALRAQIRALELQQHAVVVYLRRHGVKVPQTVFAVPRSGPVVTRPKVLPARPPHRHPRHPGTPAPTGATPTPGGVDLTWLCALLGIPACPHL